MERRKYLKTGAIAAAGAAAAAGLASTGIGTVLGQTTPTPTPTPTSTVTATATETPTLNPSGEMEVYDCIKNRRAIGASAWRQCKIRYQDTMIPDDVLNQILEAGRWASSELNIQPVEFMVVKDPITLHDLHQLNMDSVYAPWYYNYRECWPSKPGKPDMRAFDTYNAPVYVIVMTDREKRDIYPYSVDPYRAMHSDAAWAAVMNIWLAARAFGIGTVSLTFPDPIAAKRMLGIPVTMDLGPFMPLGYPTEWPDPALSTRPPSPRRPLENMVHYETFDEDKWQQYRASSTTYAANAKDAALKNLL